MISNDDLKYLSLSIYQIYFLILSYHMPKNYKKRYRNRKPKNTRTNRNRKLVTGQSEPLIDKIARYSGTVGRVARTVAGIAQLVNAEPKFVDSLAQTLSIVTTAGQLQLLTGIAQGSTDQTRNGNSVLGKDLTVNFSSFAHATPTDCTHIRLLIICDKQNDGADPTVSQIFATTGVNSPLNKDFSARFVILKSLYQSLSPSGNLGQSGKFFLRIPFHIRYDGALATVASCKENQLYFVVLSSQTTNGPTIQWSARFNFYDN